MGFLDSMFGGGGSGGGPDMGQARDDINSNYSQGREHLLPWEQAGQQGLGQYQDWLAGMQDPQAFYDKMMSGYQMSPGAQFQLNQGLDAIERAQAASGGLGSSNMAKSMNNYAQGITNQDQQQYFGNVMGINNQYGQGVGGLSQMGYNASNALNNSFMGQGNALSQLAMQQAMGQWQNQQANNQGIWGLAGMGIGAGLNYLATPDWMRKGPPGWGG